MRETFYWSNELCWLKSSSKGFDVEFPSRPSEFSQSYSSQGHHIRIKNLAVAVEHIRIYQANYAGTSIFPPLSFLYHCLKFFLLLFLSLSHSSSLSLSLRQKSFYVILIYLVKRICVKYTHENNMIVKKEKDTKNNYLYIWVAVNWHHWNCRYLNENYSWKNWYPSR